MQETGFFKWIARINSLLFLSSLVLIIGLVLYVFNETKRWYAPNEVEVIKDTSSSAYIEPKIKFHLGTITKVNGSEVQYLKLLSSQQKRGFQENTRNIVFFEGEKMESHWLFKSNNNKIDIVEQLYKPSNGSSQKDTIAIYLQVRNEDTNSNGKIDKNDTLKIALISPNGHGYTEIARGMTSVLDYSVDQEGLVLTVLTQNEATLLMKKYSLHTKEKISETEIARITKKF